MVSIERSPRRKPLQAAARGRRESDPQGGSGSHGAGPRSAWPCLPLLQVRPLPSPARDPARGPELVTHPSLAKSGEVGQGRRENKASAPNDVTLSSSKTLAFVSLRQAFLLTSSRGLCGWTGPGAPKVGGTRPSPAPLVRGRPGAGRFHTSRADKARDQAGHEAAPLPPRTPASAAGPAQLALPGQGAAPGPGPARRASAHRPPASPQPAGRTGAQERRSRAADGHTRLPQRPRFLLQLLHSDHGH